MTTLQGHLTREQIESAERPAWADQAGKKYHFDGIHFWVGTGESEHALCPAEIPKNGWWHRTDCNCHLCRGDDA